MKGCLLSLLNHLAICFLVAILTNSFLFGGIMFFFPLIFVLVYFLFHVEQMKMVIKKNWPLLAIGVVFVMALGMMMWQNNIREEQEKAAKIYAGSYSAERALGESRFTLPKSRYLDRSFYRNSTEEMIGMEGRKIIGTLKYGMYPREVYDVGDSLTISQCAAISAGRFEPTRKYISMFTPDRKLYGIQIKYYYVWTDHEDFEGQVEADLKEVIGKLSERYGEPTVNFRNDTVYHVKWNYDNQVVHWHTEIDDITMVSKLYIYLPWSSGDFFE